MNVIVFVFRMGHTACVDPWATPQPFSRSLLGKPRSLFSLSLLSGSTYCITGTSAKLLPFPAQTMEQEISLYTHSLYLMALGLTLQRHPSVRYHGWGEVISLRYRKSPDHGDWWNV